MTVLRHSSLMNNSHYISFRVYTKLETLPFHRFGIFSKCFSSLPPFLTDSLLAIKIQVIQFYSIWLIH